jgi:uncharacterized protein YndB with AHSA1/START domain
MHPLGRRRIYTLRRQPLRELAGWLDTLTEAAAPPDALLERYGQAIAREQAEASRDPDWALGRTICLQRELRAPLEEVWARWTSEKLVRDWWSPEHFEVVECEIDAVEHGIIEIVVQEGDGARYRSRGRFLNITSGQSLRFELSHLGPDDEPVFTAIHDVRLEEHERLTLLTLTVRVVAASRDAPAAIAGIEPGWEQLLTKLARTLTDQDLQAADRT